MSAELRRRVLERLGHTLDDLTFYQDDRVMFMDALDRAERQLADLRAVAEAEPQAQAITQRYGTPEPKTIRDWWR